MSGLAEELLAQRRGWDERPFVRALYNDWYARMERLLSPVQGPVIELGSGIGTLRETITTVRPTDVAPTPWTDEVADGQRLPFADASVANLLAVDVLHHVPRPLEMLAEAQRVLVPGGRLILLEPYGSPASRFAYRHFHREPFEMGVDPFAGGVQSSDEPLDGNGALPTLLFFRHAARITERMSGLELVHRSRLAPFAYPLSGGLLGRRLLPDRALGAAQAIDRMLGPLGRLLAFRCLVALQRG